MICVVTSCYISVMSVRPFHIYDIIASNIPFNTKVARNDNDNDNGIKRFYNSKTLHAVGLDLGITVSRI